MLLPPTDHPCAVHQSPDPRDARRRPLDIYADVLRCFGPPAADIYVSLPPRPIRVRPDEAVTANSRRS